MQYLLTEMEYEALKKSAGDIGLKQEKAKQKFCTLVADTMPVKTWLNEGKPTPWGCIITRKEEWYCDQCPAQDFCPFPHKRWSK